MLEETDRTVDRKPILLRRTIWRHSYIVDVMEPVVALAEHVQWVHRIVGIVVDLARSRALILSSGTEPHCSRRIGGNTHIETVHRFMERSQVRRDEARKGKRGSGKRQRQHR